MAQRATELQLSEGAVTITLRSLHRRRVITPAPARRRRRERCAPLEARLREGCSAGECDVLEGDVVGELGAVEAGVHEAWPAAIVAGAPLRIRESRSTEIRSPLS